MEANGAALPAASDASVASAASAVAGRAAGHKRPRSAASAAAASHSDCEVEGEIEEDDTRARAAAGPASRRKKKVCEGGHEGVSASSQLQPLTIMDLLDGISDDDALPLMQLALQRQDDDR
jgi:hypothetical protein